MSKLAMWKKEKKEHPWTTDAQAKRIARDHAKLKRERKRRKKK